MRKFFDKKMNDELQEYVDYYYDILKELHTERAVYTRALSFIQTAENSSQKKIEEWKNQIAQLESEIDQKTDEVDESEEARNRNSTPKSLRPVQRSPKKKTSQNAFSYSTYKKK